MKKTKPLPIWKGWYRLFSIFTKWG